MIMFVYCEGKDGFAPFQISSALSPQQNGCLYLLGPYKDYISGSAYIMALHMYYLVRSIWGMLSNKFGTRFFIVLEYTMKTEYQGRGTPHWHIAAWVVCFGHISLLAGRSHKIISSFAKFLELVFRCEIDVQVGNGRLNYINGYVSKDHDSVDVALGEYVQKGATAPMACSVSFSLRG